MSGFGDTLRHARANRGVTLTEAERAIRIPRKYLRALEDEDFSQLPEGVYSRGIVRNYAQYLNLDPDDAIAYFEDLRGSYSGGFKVVPAVKPMELPSHWAPNFALIAFMVVISAVLFAWLYSALFAARDALPTPTTGIATPTVINTTPAVLSLTPTVTPTPPPTPTLAPTAPPPPTQPPAVAPPAQQVAAAPPAPAQPAPAQQPAPQPQPQAKPPTPTPQPKPQPAAHRHVITVKALEEAWVSVTVDGEVQFADTMAPGKMLNFEGNSLVVESGNAGNVYLWVDGGDYGLLSTSSWSASVSVP